ncbi:methyltransferase domain-containing protein [Tamlana fucoidanivorans]|uniref:Methyltransferase domain-containing protein n=1 Tax=Allotamlana fucoidanivorans TaxID=2583814 RepID=A0A5C4SGQ4_9FLAO|nr:methyltransferase domain-containing protein [Tamlana fucoidanivorans]TNJ42535.1 methyltransferase domain-containing protein [Tamlana fucoidanivorans]
MQGLIKAHTVDKYLHPVRLQILELIEPNTTVVELGCGNGDLLFKLSNKIKAGIGIDKSEQLIKYASNQIKKKQIKNLEFRAFDILQNACLNSKTDYTIACLVFHILPRKEAIVLLKKMIATSKTTIICGFSKPENLKQKTFLWFDQRFTSHYSHFCNFMENGFTEGLLHPIENIKYQKIDTFDPVIKIYKITQRQPNSK